jgi:hypothetical protein
MKNSFTIDRVLRIIIGISIIAAGIIFSSPWGLIGILPLLAGIINKCPSFIPGKYSACDIPAEETQKEN